MISRRHLTLLARFASAQLLVQALGFVGAIVLLRVMQPEQYALYTVALSFTGVAAVLTDLGMVASMLALGARWLRRIDALATLHAQTRAMHRHLALWALPLLPLLVLLLMRQHAGATQAIALALLVGAIAWLQVAGSVDLALLRLLGLADWQQRMEVFTQCGKLAALLVLGAVSFWLPLDAVAATAVNMGLGAALALLARRQLVGLLAPAHVPTGAALATTAVADHATREPTPTGPIDHRPALREYLWRQGPNSVYYVVNAQIVLWLTAWFGQADTVAQAGALGRLAALFTVIASVTSSLLLPHFARAGSNADVGAGLARVHGFYALLLMALLALALGAPGLMLWVLGGHYADLSSELAWLVLGTTLASWGGTVYSVACTRGWVMPLTLSATTGLASTALAAALVDVGSLRGALLINCAVGATGLLVGLGYLRHQLNRPDAPLPRYA
jgi:hypothetical protein